MRPVIKNKIAFFHPTGFLDGENAREIISPHDLDFLIQAKPEGAFISLKKVVFFNKRGITLLLEALSQAHEKIGVIIGFCDYDERKYKMFLDMFKNGLYFSLFDSAAVATLFLGDDPSSAKDKKILVFHEKSDQKNQLAMELYERGFTPEIAKNHEDFMKRRKDFDIVIAHAYLGNLDKTPMVFIKENVIVYTLKSFVDSDLYTKFDTIYHNHCLRVGFKVFLFEASEVSSINVHGVNFIAKLSTAAAEYGATIAICGLDSRKISEKLTNDLEDAGILIYKNIATLFEDASMMKEASATGSVAKKIGGVTKQLVETLPIIMASCMKTIEVLSKCKIEKKSIKIQPLELDKNMQMQSASIAFFGSLNGVLVLSFEKEVAKNVCKVLLDEGYSDTDLLDAVGELVHILGTKIVHQLLKKGISIDVTMPRTFDSIEDLLNSQQGVKGAQVDFEVNEKPFSIFLTR